MSAIALRSEERLGLGIAVAAHLALIAALVVTAAHRPEMVKLPARMVVSLAKDVSLTSTAPEPAQEAQASIAETVTEMPTPPPLEQQPEQKKPQPVEKPAPKPRPIPKKAPERVEKPTPKQDTAPKEKAKPQPKPKTQKSGGSLIGKNFLQGLGASTASEAKAPAAAMGPAEQASLQQSIARQLRPHWKPPSGVDADQLITILAFDLNRDGSLAGKPRVVGQSGIDAANKAQASRHAELAVRAVELAAPFDLPPEYYDAWKRIKAWKFDWKSAQ